MMMSFKPELTVAEKLMRMHNEFWKSSGKPPIGWIMGELYYLELKRELIEMSKYTKAELDMSNIGTFQGLPIRISRLQTLDIEVPFP